MGRAHGLGGGEVAYWQEGLTQALRREALGQSAESHALGGIATVGRHVAENAPSKLREIGGVAAATGIAGGTVAGIGYGGKKLFEAANPDERPPRRSGS